MQPGDRTRILRGLGLGLGSLLLLSGAAFASQSGNRTDDRFQAAPSGSLHESESPEPSGSPEVDAFTGGKVEDPSESPEASPEASPENEPGDDNGRDQDEDTSPSTSPSADEANDDHGGGDESSGPGNGDEHDGSDDNSGPGGEDSSGPGGDDSGHHDGSDD